MKSRLHRYWLADVLRLREEHWGPLQDAAEIRQLRASDAPLEERVLQRAELLARRDSLDDVLVRWRRYATLAMALLLALAVAAGAGAAMAALGDGTRPVNLLGALMALLVAHGVTFILWLLSLGLRMQTGGAAARLWLWLTERLARGPDAALAPQALADLLSRAGVLRWALGAVSHILWIVALVAALLVLLVQLSTRRYGFVWETTLLSPDTLVALTQALGRIPGWFGFAMPDTDQVRLSDGLQALSPGVQAQWSVWLLGSLVVYGLLPRVLALLACLLMAVRRMTTLRLDLSLPGYAGLRERLQPASVALDANLPEPDGPSPARAQHAVSHGTEAVLAGIELPDDLPWPPARAHAAATTGADTASHAPNWRDAGLIDTRAQRNALLDALATHPAARLLIVCDGRQTPDRGTIALVAELAALAADCRIWLAGGSADATPARAHLWQERLTAAGLAAAAVSTDPHAPWPWLEHTA